MSIRAALEIGGSHVTAALVESSQRRGWGPRSAGPDSIRVVRSERRPLRADGTAEEIIERIVHCGRAIPLGPSPWRVAVPGPFDYDRGIALFQGVGKFDALYGVDLGAALLDGLPGPASTVTFLNDAAAFLLGEWTVGAAAGHARAVGITLGTGVGSAFLADGELVTGGPAVPPEGRVDLLTWDGHPLEETVSRRAIRARYAHARTPATALPTADVAEVASRARAGDATARTVLAETFTALGLALAPWIARFNASVLVIGGSMSASWDLLAPPLSAGLAVVGPRLAIYPARNRRDAALIGAAMNGRETT